MPTDARYPHPDPADWTHGPARRAAAVLLVLAAALASAAMLGRSRPAADPAHLSTSPPHASLIDANTATPGEFEALPGIGPTLARRIVQDRESRGLFRSVEDLDRVSGIGPATLDRLRPFIFVR